MVILLFCLEAVIDVHLQKALKEKQEHVEQLLKERDLERSEFAKTAAQIDEVSVF